MIIEAVAFGAGVLGLLWHLREETRRIDQWIATLKL